LAVFINGSLDVGKGFIGENSGRMCGFEALAIFIVQVVYYYIGYLESVS
jgi:hypothetical protein